MLSGSALTPQDAFSQEALLHMSNEFASGRPASPASDVYAAGGQASHSVTAPQKGRPLTVRHGMEAADAKRCQPSTAAGVRMSAEPAVQPATSWLATSGRASKNPLA